MDTFHSSIETVTKQFHDIMSNLYWLFTLNVQLINSNLNQHNKEIEIVNILLQ